jgi:hypothetical protein
MPVGGFSIGRVSHFWGPMPPFSMLLLVNSENFVQVKFGAHPFSALRGEAPASTGLAVDSSPRCRSHMGDDYARERTEGPGKPGDS